MKVRIEILEKEGCHLCEVAHRYLIELQEELGFELVSRDILSDPLLHQRYRWEIPVILVDGEEWARHRIESELFEGRLLKRIEATDRQRGGSADPSQQTTKANG